MANNRLDISYAKTLLENYKQNHWTIVNGSCPSLHQNPNFPNVQDSRSVWFSLDTLKSFIAAIEGPNPGCNLGVRVYFGEHSADTVLQDQGGPNYIGLHTLLMVPTISGQDALNHDFDPATGSSDFSQSADICALNHGTLNPPPFYNNIPSAQQQNMGLDFMTFSDQNP